MGLTANANKKKETTKFSMSFNNIQGTSTRQPKQGQITPVEKQKRNNLLINPKTKEALRKR